MRASKSSPPNVAFGDDSSTTASTTPPGASPEEQSWLFTRLLYSWITPLIDTSVALASGANGTEPRALQKEDLLELPSEEWSDAVYHSAFIPLWEAELTNPTDPAKGPSLLTTLRRAYGYHVYVGAIHKLTSDLCMIAIPVILQIQLRWLSRYVQDPEDFKDRMWEGYMLSVAIMALMLVYTYTMNASVFYTSKAFMKMRTACMLAIFDKSLKLPASHSLTGRISQMHGTDCSKFLETSILVQQVWSGPIKIAGAMIILYLFIGPASLVGLGAAALTVPVQGKAARMMGIGRMLASKMSDKRLTRVNEFVQGIRIIKFMSWERQFESSTETTRQREMVHLITMHKANAVFQIVLSWVPQVIACATFASAYAMGVEMSPETVFPTLALLNILRAPLAVMPLAIAKLMELLVTVDRVGTFLLSEEHVSVIEDVPVEPTEGQETLFTRDVADVHSATMLKEDLAVYIPSATVVYEAAAVANDSILSPPMNPLVPPAPSTRTSPDLTTSNPSVEAVPEEVPETIRRFPLLPIEDFKVPRGKLTVVIGPTAGGKSTLVNAIMGEALLSAESASVYRRGSVGYVPQEAWIMNATVRDNILMGKELDVGAYKRALLACQLKSDLEQLASSDGTEIGERGINLSGGQKQRVAFARAVYSDSDTVVMDDPLSAVDPHVCVSLFHSCIRAALDGRTRILITHQQQFLPFADRVVVIADRQILFSGTYDELQEDQATMMFVSQAASPTKGDKAAGGEAGDADVLDETDSQLSAAATASVEAGRRTIEKLAEQWSIPPPRQQQAALMQVERQDLSAIGMPIYLWYCRQSGWTYVISAISLYILWRVTSIIADLILSWWATGQPVFGQEMTGDEYLMWFGIAIIVVGVFVILRMYPLVLGAINASRHAHARMIHGLLHSPMSFFDTTPTGRILNRCSKDLEMLDVVVPETLSITYNLLLMVLGAWALQTVGAWPMPIVYVIVVTLFTMLFKGYVVTNHGVKRLDAVLRSPVLSIMNEALGGLPTIRSYAMTEAYRVTHEERVHNMNKSSYAWRNLQRWLAVRTDVLSAVIIGAVGMTSIGLLSLLPRQERIDFYPIAALGMTYAVVVTGAIGFLTTMLAELIAGLSSVERVREYADELEAEREVTYTGDEASREPVESEAATITALQTETLLPLSCAAPPANWPMAGSVTFDNVYLRYRAGLDLVLKGVSFSAQAGEKVGIVGRTGSGKSTIMLSLFRMIETDKSVTCSDASGAGAETTNRILIDGVDIAHLKLDELRTKITIIPQDPLLFAGTIRSNLDPFEQHGDERIWEVLRKAHIHGRIESEELQLDCPVTDRGSNFSAGERQLLCLARALLKDCKILLLDEATASIDPQHDQLLQETIRREFAERTVLTIAHRLGTIIDSDKVLVLDAGSVSEFGSPHELLQRTPGWSMDSATDGGAFWSMVHELGDEEEARLHGIARAKSESK